MREYFTYFFCLLASLPAIHAFHSHDNIHPNNSLCWEECFHVVDCPDYEHLRAAYNDFYQAGMEANRLKNMYGVNGTALLFDTSLSSYHEPSAEKDYEEFGARIFKLQKDMAAIIATMLASTHEMNPLYIAQYDEMKGWSCDEWECLHTCSALRTIDRMECVHTTTNGKEDDKIEPACRVAADKMHASKSYCSSMLSNMMAIAFINSDFDHNVERMNHNHGNHQHYSACRSHFPTRMAVGTHAVDEHELDGWQSYDAKYFYIRDNKYTMEAADTLKWCMRRKCCEGRRWEGYQSNFPHSDDTCHMYKEVDGTHDGVLVHDNYTFPEYNAHGSIVTGSL